MRYLSVRLSHDSPEISKIQTASYYELTDALKWMDEMFNDHKATCAYSNPQAYAQELLEHGIPTLIATASDSEKSCFILRASEAGKSSLTFSPFGYEIVHPLRYCLEESGRGNINTGSNDMIQRTPLSVTIIM